MKATGIVRRIDDLGRVVIPREIRQRLKISEGDPLELFIEKDGVTFLKYTPSIVRFDHCRLCEKEIDINNSMEVCDSRICEKCVDVIKGTTIF